jgi:hypothetical protein
VRSSSGSRHPLLGEQPGDQVATDEECGIAEHLAALRLGKRAAVASKRATSPGDDFSNFGNVRCPRCGAVRARTVARRLPCR